MKNEIFILACFIPETGNEKGNKVGKIKLNPTHQRILEEMRKVVNMAKAVGIEKEEFIGRVEEVYREEMT